MKHIYTTLALFCMILGAALSAEDHAGHDHGDHAGHDHGKEKSAVLGDVTLGPSVLEVSSHSAFKAGAEFGLEIVIEKGSAPATLRAWVGIKNARGSVKSLLTLDKNGKGYHAHLAVPKKLPEGSKVWFEASDAEGTKSKASLALPKKEQKKDDDDDHDHAGHDHGDHKH